MRRLGILSKWEKTQKSLDEEIEFILGGRGDIIGLQDGFKKASFMDIGFLKEPPGEEGKGLLMGVISS